MYYLGLAPPRFAALSGLEQYFAMARGTDDIQLALDMSKYFDTNYRALAFPKWPPTLFVPFRGLPRQLFLPLSLWRRRPAPLASAWSWLSTAVHMSCTTADIPSGKCGARGMINRTVALHLNNAAVVIVWQQKHLF